MAGRYFVRTWLTTVLTVAVLTTEAYTQVDLFSCQQRSKRAVQNRGRHGRSGHGAFGYPLQQQECGDFKPIEDAPILPVPHLAVERISTEDDSPAKLDRVKIKWCTPRTGYGRVTGFEISIESAGRGCCACEGYSDSCRQLLLNRTLDADDAISENYFEYIADLPTGLTYRITARPLPGQTMKGFQQETADYVARKCESLEERRKLWKPPPVQIVKTVGRNVTVKIFLAPEELEIAEYELWWTCGPDQQTEEPIKVDASNTNGATLNTTLYHLPPGTCDIWVEAAISDPIRSNTSFNITDWTPANLTAHYDGTEVSVTFRAAPPEYDFPEYRICLVNTSTSDSRASEPIRCNPLISTKDSSGVITAVFKDAKPLRTRRFYAVKVSAPYQDSQWTQVSANAVHPSQHHSTRHLVLAVTLAVVVGLALLGALYYIYRQRKELPRTNIFVLPRPGESGSEPVCPERTPTLFLLYSYDCPEHFRVVECSATFLQKMGFPVILDMWCTNQIGCVGKTDWVYEHMDKADFVIVICSRGARHKMEGKNDPPLQEGYLGDMFTPWAKEIGSRIHSDDALSSGSRQKYVVAYFSYSSAEDVPRVLRASQPHYRLMKHMPELFCHLLGIERRGPRGTAIITGLETEEGQKLVEAIDAMQKICDQKPDWLFQRNDGPAPDVIDAVTSSASPEEIPLLPTPSESSVETENSTPPVGDAQGEGDAQPLLSNGATNAVDGQQDDSRVEVCPPEDVSVVTGKVEPTAAGTGTIETVREHREDDPESGIHTASETSMEGPTSTLAQVRPSPASAASAPQVQYPEYGATAQGGTSYGNNPEAATQFNYYTSPWPTMDPNMAQHYGPGNIYGNPMYVRSPSYDQQPYMYNVEPGNVPAHAYRPGASPYRDGSHHNSDEQLDSGIFMAEIEEELRRHNQLVSDSMPPEY
ncbi:PREDICTED: uncharacterized protein LOC109469217 [Branchiostoma belcheri]|uniref:Uncharacterized protein LOC109469217 n=1 Tax=Branchiostoma belcheri TaxID=7741 RepID=A0A6P4YFK9_BRABE|nr:PREDICTED: uncharacterized protein LOC109469217 [Branchiostoma belcheri]